MSQVPSAAVPVSVSAHGESDKHMCERFVNPVRLSAFPTLFRCLHQN